jgi:hypothetical protein
MTYAITKNCNNNGSCQLGAPVLAMSAMAANNNALSAKADKN